MREAIYKGATRPAMKAGVPLVVLVALLVPTVVIVMWTGLLLSWWIALLEFIAVAALYVRMRMLTKKDDQRLLQAFIDFKLRFFNKNKRLWKTRSYSPTLYRGLKDDWHQ